MNDKFLILFEDCRIVEGYKNAIIYDLNRVNNSNFIPKSLVTFIKECENRKIGNVLRGLSNPEDKKIALGYINFIIEREFGFLADDHVKSHMGKLNLNFENSSSIYNSIVCLKSENVVTFENIQKQLDELLCVNIEIRCVNFTLNDLYFVLNCTADSVLEAVIIRIIYTDKFELNVIENILAQYFRIRHIYIYQSPQRISSDRYTFLTQKVDFTEDCGIIAKEQFKINQPFFIESQSCNTCLNKKVSIDFDGNIKNCPSSFRTFGLIGETDLKKTLLNEDFLKKWSIKKDEIEVCKDCEYRHMCLDCRVFIDNPNNQYSRPSKCNYNPYIGKWKDEDGFLPVEQMGVFKNNRFIKDDKKIAKFLEA